MVTLRQHPQIIEQSITAFDGFVPSVIREKGHTFSQSSIDKHWEAVSSFFDMGVFWQISVLTRLASDSFCYRSKLTSVLRSSCNYAPRLFSKGSSWVPIAKSSPKPLSLKRSCNAKVLRSQRGCSQVEVLLLHHGWWFTVFAPSPSPYGKAMQNTSFMTKCPPLLLLIYCRVSPHMNFVRMIYASQ